MNRPTLLAALNALGLVFALVMNGLANAIPLGGKTTGELSDLYPNLFVPAGLTFSIWGLIYLLLIAFVGFQLVSAFKGDERAALDRIGPWFLVSCAANGLWIAAWHYQRPAVALLLMLALLGSLLAMYLRLDVGRAAVDGARRWLVELPVSVYLGWITVATIANVTTVLVDLGYGELPPGPVFWTVTVIVVAIGIGAAMVQLRRDRAFAAVVVWALLGIVIKRSAEPVPGGDTIVITAAVGIVVLLILMGLCFLRGRSAPG